ncbi:unnamed protein product [Allacma fusca]|uniref:Uncharacterized protein n=1 Tax=Allacma fusca TaxID=39272 RepID=A0A8J2KBY8_9HEXA|nr:unnamed protein product [Allacma fusca]
MTLPAGQSVSVTFTNLFTLITNFLTGKGASFQNLFKKGNLQGMIRNVTGVRNFNLSQQLGNGLFGGAQFPGTSQGTKVGTTNLMTVLLSSLANSSGPKAGGSGTGQGSNSQRQGGLLGGFAGTNTGGNGFFNRG